MFADGAVSVRPSISGAVQHLMVYRKEYDYDWPVFIVPEYVSMPSFIAGKAYWDSGFREDDVFENSTYGPSSLSQIISYTWVDDGSAMLYAIVFWEDPIPVIPIPTGIINISRSNASNQSYRVDVSIK
jgi:hypothetical protein